jgi:hypothetical protein
MQNLKGAPGGFGKWKIDKFGGTEYVQFVNGME